MQIKIILKVILSGPSIVWDAQIGRQVVKTRRCFLQRYHQRTSITQIFWWTPNKIVFRSVSICI